MDRRQVLRGSVVVATAAFAGCQGLTSSDEEGGSDDEADDEDEETDTPEETATGTPTETPTPEPGITSTLEETFAPTEGFGSFEDVAVLSDGGYVLSGSIRSAGGSSAWMVRIDESGAEQWSETYGVGDSSLDSIVESDDGTIVGTGQTSGADGSTNGFVQAVSPEGTPRWSTPLSGEGNTILKGVVETTDGYIATGATGLARDGSADAWMVSLDSGGTIRDDRAIGAPFFRLFNQVVAIGDGEYGLVGTTSPERGTSSGTLVVIDGDLQTQFTREYSEQQLDGFRDGVALDDGGFLFTGETSQQAVRDDSDEDAWVVRADARGREQWSATWDGGDGDRFWDVAPAPDGSAFCVGQTDVASGIVDTAVAARVENGTVTETATFGNEDESASDTNQDALSCVTRGPDGTMVCGGLKDLEQSGTGASGAGWLLTF